MERTLVDSEHMEIKEMDGFPFFPELVEKREILDGSTGQMRKEYDVVVVLKGSRRLPMKTFYSIQNICYSERWDECCDAELAPSQKKALKIFLQKQAAHMKFKKILYVDQLGFVNDCPDLYIYDKLNWFWKNRCDSEVCADKKLPIFRQDEGMELSVALERLGVFIDLLPGVTDILTSVLVYSVIAPVVSKELGIGKFFVFMYGESGVHKTTLAKLFFAESEKQMKSFSVHSKRDLLKSIQDFPGHAVIIDDYHPMAKKYDKEKQESILDMIARAENNDRNALAIVTGEFLDGCFSLQDRMIQIEVPRVCNSVHAEGFYKKLNECQRDRNILRTIEVAFLARFFAHYGENVGYLRNELSHVRKEYPGCRIEGNSHLLLVVVQLFEKLFPEILKLEFSRELEDSIMKICERQKRHMEKIRLLEGKKWVTIIRKILDQESEALVHRPSGKRWFQEIIYERGKCYIPKLWLQSKLESFFGKRINMKELIDDIESKGILLTDQSSANTKKMGGHRYYVVDVERLRNSVQ